MTGRRCAETSRTTRYKRKCATFSRKYVSQGNRISIAAVALMHCFWKKLMILVASKLTITTGPSGSILLKNY